MLSNEGDSSNNLGLQRVIQRLIVNLINNLKKGSNSARYLKLIDVNRARETENLSSTAFELPFTN